MDYAIVAARACGIIYFIILVGSERPASGLFTLHVCLSCLLGITDPAAT